MPLAIYSSPTLSMDLFARYSDYALLLLLVGGTRWNVGDGYPQWTYLQGIR